MFVYGWSTRQWAYVCSWWLARKAERPSDLFSLRREFARETGLFVPPDVEDGPDGVLLVAELVDQFFNSEHGHLWGIA